MKSRIVVAAFAIALPTFCSAASYNVTDLGTLGGEQSAAYGINASGQVVGWANTDAGTQHAFLYSGGVMQDLGALPTSADTSVGASINASGQVTGYGGPFNAFLYSGGVMQSLSTAAHEFLLGLSINASGDVAGYGYHVADTVPGYHALLYSGGLTTDLGLGTASGVNDSGQVVGTNSGGAFLYSGGVIQNLESFPGASGSQAMAINNLGEVTGFAESDNGVQAFLYSGGVMQNLGTVPGGFSGRGLAINNNGQVVGYGGSVSHAFLYSGGVMVDLNTLIDQSSGWVLLRAYGINDSGQITGEMSVNGFAHAFLATPIPEPSTLVLAALGLIGFAVWGWRRRYSRSG